MKKRFRKSRLADWFDLRTERKVLAVLDGFFPDGLPKSRTWEVGLSGNFEVVGSSFHRVPAPAVYA